MDSQVHYDGWELPFFDKAINFRNYQISIIKNHLKGSLCEIGPGSGLLCEKYYKYCDDVTLFEPSKNLSEGLVKKFQYNSKVKILETTFSASIKKFDCILLMDVLEHIEDSSLLIKKLYENLETGGNLLINVPAFKHLYSSFDKDVGHLKRYNKHSFTKETLLISPKSINMFYYDSIGYFLSLFSQISSFILKDYKKNFKQKIAIWDFLIPASKLFDKVTLNTLGKSLFIVITK